MALASPGADAQLPAGQVKKIYREMEVLCQPFFFPNF
jgi:hypothetical protein